MAYAGQKLGLGALFGASRGAILPLANAACELQLQAAVQTPAEADQRAPEQLISQVDVWQLLANVLGNQALAEQ